MYDLPVLDGDDRDEPIVIGRAARQNLSMYLVLEDYDAAVLRMVDDKRAASVKMDRLTVHGEAGHEIGPSSNQRSPSGKVIAGLKCCVLGKRIEIVIAVNESA